MSRLQFFYSMTGSFALVLAFGFNALQHGLLHTPIDWFLLVFTALPIVLAVIGTYGLCMSLSIRHNRLSQTKN